MQPVVRTVLDYLTDHFIETSACGVVALCLLGFWWWWHQYRILHGKDPTMSAEELLAWDTRTDEERDRERAARRRQSRVELAYFDRDQAGRRAPRPDSGAPWTPPTRPPAEDLVKSADTREDTRARNPISPRESSGERSGETPPTRKKRIRPKRQQP